MRNMNDKYKEWKARVNVRDNFTCQICGKQGVNEAHHIKPWRKYPELRYDVDNGQTLCLDCHRKLANNRGRPKLKDGKATTFYLSFFSLEILRELSYKQNKSRSQIVEDLILECQNQK